MKIFLFLITSIICLNLHSLSAQNTKLIGQWKGTGNGVEGIITMDKKGFVSINTNGEIVGGKKFSGESGIQLKMIYETNEASNPHTIDFVMKTLDDALEVHRALGIYKFMDDKTLVLVMDFQGVERPRKFDNKNPDQMTMTKIK
jgi:uncharacterized protein (TIGR03067 family)